LGRLLASADESRRWRLIAEFLEDCRWETAETRVRLLDVEPPATGDQMWDIFLFLAALAEHVAARDGRAAASRDRRSCGLGSGDARAWPAGCSAGLADAVP
jgi:hypothetical protein